MQLVDLWYFILSLIQKDWIAWASVVLYYFFKLRYCFNMYEMIQLII